MEESENEMVNNLDESEESVDMIMVASSENSKKDEEILEGDHEADEEGEVSADEEEEEESELQSDDANDAKDNDDNVPAESEVVEETVVKKSPKPVQKKTKKKDKGKQIDNYDVS